MASFGEEIKQEVFLNEIQKSTLNVVFTATWISDKLLPFFKEYGILHQHYNVLRIVRGKKGKPTSPGQIIEVMMDKGRDLTRLVDKLVKLDFLERKPCDTNRRKIEIYLTERGLQVTSLLEDEINAWYQNEIGISEEEAAHLNLLLDKIRNK